MDTDLMYMRLLGRKVKRSMKAPDLGSYVKRSTGTVTAVSGAKASVNFGNSDVPMIVDGIRIAKSCAGVAVSNEVLVDTVGHVSVITAVLM